MWKRSASPVNSTKNALDDKFAVLAVKVELVMYYKPFNRKKQDSWESGHANALGQSHSTLEIMAFVATLRDSESSKFDGWHYLKVDGPLLRNPR